MKEMSSELIKVIEECNKKYFKKPLGFIHLGGSIPVTTRFQEYYNDAHVFVTGVSFPTSNCHGPDENLDLGYFKPFYLSLATLI